MLISKKIFLNLILSMSVMSLAACNLPTPKDKKSTDATGYSENDNSQDSGTFKAEPDAKKSSVLEVKTAGAFNLPSSKVFNFVACLKDVAYDKIIAGHKFKIEEANKEVTSDVSGCVVWSETVKFNFLADSQYIKIKRHIRASGIHKGMRTVVFAINPWSHGESLSPVLDLKSGTVVPNLVETPEASQKALNGFSADGKKITRPVWLEEGRFFSVQENLESGALNLMVEVRGTPSIQLTKLNGELTSRSLAAGTFKARLQLIHSLTENGKDMRISLGQTELLDAKMENGSLSIRGRITLKKIPTFGSLVLGVALIPVNGPEGLTPFDGIYVLGDYDQLKGNAPLKLASEVAQTKDFKLAKYVNTELSPEMAEKGPYQTPKIEVEELEPTPLRVSNETTSQRTVSYRIKACMKSGVDQKIPRSQTFQVSKFREKDTDAEKMISVTTAPNTSCITWEESFTIKIFECNKYIHGSVKISNKELGMNQTLELLVSPWKTSGFSLFDKRYTDKDSQNYPLTCDATKNPPAEIALNKYAYSPSSSTSTAVTNKVDDLLNLYVEKKMTLVLEPYLPILSSFAGKDTRDPFHNGTYLLKVAVVKAADSEGNLPYVTSSEKLVKVKNGVINTDLTLVFHDLKAYSSRNTFLVEIFPVREDQVKEDSDHVTLLNPKASMDSVIDKTANLIAPTFAGSIVPNLDEASRPLKVISPDEVKSLLRGKAVVDGNAGIITQLAKEGEAARLAKIKALKARFEKGAFATENNYDLINLNSAEENGTLSTALKIANRNSKLELSKTDLRDVITKHKITPTLAQKFCAFWIYQYLPQMSKAKGGAVLANMQQTAGMDCYRAVMNNPTSFFKVEGRMLVKEIGDSQHLGTVQDSMNVGANFQMASAHQKSRTASFSIGGKAGLGKKFLDLWNLGADIGGTISWSVSDSNNVSNTVNVSQTKTLNISTKRESIPVKKFELCALVNLNPMLFVEDNSSWFFSRPNYMALLNPRLDESEMVYATTRGLMLCEGQVRNQPMNIIENYIQVSQDMKMDTDDVNNEANRQFFVTLRSDNDFYRFVLAVKGTLNNPPTALKDFDISTTARRIEGVMRLNNPSAPGMITVR